MAEIRYRLFLNGKPASREQLSRFEQITVEQEVDMATAGRFELPICIDSQGKWGSEDTEFMRSFSRIRLEVQVGDNPFVALIDGPIVRPQKEMVHDPGQSLQVLNVQDDSCYLNRDVVIARFDNLLDHEIARKLLSDCAQITACEIEATPAPGNSIPSVVQRDTAMNMLRSLAKRQNMHVYVTPGAEPGHSIGHFKKFPESGVELPPLRLFGSGRNTSALKAVTSATAPANIQASILQAGDKSVISRTAKYQETAMLGNKPLLAEDQAPANLVLPPYLGESVSLDQAVAGAANAASYAVQVSGSILAGCYNGVLQLYRLVDVQSGGTEYTGTYVIIKVTHKLTRSSYHQAFTLTRNSLSRQSNDAKASAKRSIH